MAFDTVYPNRKDWRKAYRGSKRFDRSCRPNGSDSWDRSNRTIQAQRENERAKVSLTDLED